MRHKTLKRALHKDCGKPVTEIWRELNEYPTYITPEGETFCGGDGETIDGGDREGFYCNECDRYIEPEEIVREVVRVPS